MAYYLTHFFLPSFYLVFPPGLRKQILAAAFQQGPAIQIPLKEEQRLTSEPFVKTALIFRIWWVKTNLWHPRYSKIQQRVKGLVGFDPSPDLYG